MVLKFFKCVTVLLFTIFLCTAPSFKKDQSHIGKWRGIDKGDIGYLTLTKDRYATFEFGGEIMGGNSYNHSGINASLKYRINTKKEPHEINFVIWDKKKAQEAGRMRGISRMIDKNKMQMAINFTGSNTRPSNFNSNSIVFHRMVE